MDRENRLKTCKHFTGLMPKNCDVGIDYDTVKVSAPPAPPRWPCMYDGVDIPCALRVHWTNEDLDKQDAEYKVMFSNMVAARAAIVEFTQGKRGISGKIDCPNCEGGKLSFSVAHGNGHIHAQCSTEGCTSWIE